MQRSPISAGETVYLTGLALALAIALYGVLGGWWWAFEGDDDDRTVIEDLIFSGD